MQAYKDLLEDALKLGPIEKVHLIDGLMASLEKPDPEIDALWDQEALQRYQSL